MKKRISLVRSFIVCVCNHILTDIAASTTNCHTWLIERNEALRGKISSGNAEDSVWGDYVTVGSAHLCTDDSICCLSEGIRELWDRDWFRQMIMTFSARVYGSVYVKSEHGILWVYSSVAQKSSPKRQRTSRGLRLNLSNFWKLFSPLNFANLKENNSFNKKLYSLINFFSTVESMLE